MGTVTKRELNQQTSRVLASAQSDGPVTVTERGVPLWRIEAVSGYRAPADRLREAGRIVAAKADPAPWVFPAGKQLPQRTPADVDALLSELREDGRL